MTTWTEEVYVFMKHIYISLGNTMLSILEPGWLLILEVIFHSQNLKPTALSDSHEANISAREKLQYLAGKGKTPKASLGCWLIAHNSLAQMMF